MGERGAGIIHHSFISAHHLDENLPGLVDITVVVDTEHYFNSPMRDHTEIFYG